VIGIRRMPHPKEEAKQQQGEEIHGPVDHAGIVGGFSAIAKARKSPV
jgi:hypothetical protein